MLKRYNIRVTGIVQGVGFRPFVYNLALSRNISGFVGNDSDGVFIEAQGAEKNITEFIRNIEKNPPPLSMVEAVHYNEIPAVIQNGFHIKESVKGESMSTLISPDMAVCQDCAKELREPGDRREHYPFINCTNCGPRYSIIHDIPYDRPKTSMQEFEMCPDCSAEYHDPANRRFHAQPNACPVCGPWVELYDSGGKKLQEKPYAIVLAKKLLKKGGILAIKGMGGFHLACDARNTQAVQQLRERKHRVEKPLAVMVKDLQTAKKLVHLCGDEIRLLTSQQAPIVLAKKKTDINPFIAPGNPRLGIMLPYTPLHQLLFNHTLDALIMTSANLSEEPICIDNQDAFQRLEGIAEFFLVHNRDILQRVDDSVTIILEDKPTFIRRSRGYVPRPIALSRASDTILSVGAELKNTLCYTKADSAFISQHIGDLANMKALNFFHQTREHLAKMLEIQPEYIAYDMHPGYLATKWALEQPYPKFSIQHHHAHMASVLADNATDEPVIGFMMDGTGYGTDGNIWGGEVFVGDNTEVTRFAHFENMPMPGGDKAILEPWRMGLSYLYDVFGDEFVDHLPEGWARLPVQQIVQMVEKGINSPLTSSCGRLFDGISALAGGRTDITFEGQAAIEFQHAMEEGSDQSLNFVLEKIDGHYEVQIAPIVRDTVQALKSGKTFGEISTFFHNMLVKLFSHLATVAKEETGISTVALSGGVFQNSYLFGRLVQELKTESFTVLTHSQVPANDGGISFGQVAVAQALLEKNQQKVNYIYS